MTVSTRPVAAPAREARSIAGAARVVLALTLAALGTPALARTDAAQARARFERAVTRAQRRRPDMRDWSNVRRAAYQSSLNDRLEAPIAVLEVPRFGIEVPVMPKDDDASLDRAVSYVRGTALPGHHGNVGIAGHRDSYFRRLEKARRGDVIRLVAPDGVRTYRVAETKVLRPEAVEVLAPTDRDALTLVTCFPFRYVGHAPERFVVRAYVAAQPPGRGARSARALQRPGSARANAWHRVDRRRQR